MNQISIKLKEKQTIEHKGKLYHITIKEIPKEKCICGCGKKRKGQSKYAAAACRTRYWRSKQDD